jgi:hypothetical protein
MLRFSQKRRRAETWARTTETETAPAPNSALAAARRMRAYGQLTGRRLVDRALAQEVRKAPRMRVGLGFAGP